MNRCWGLIRFISFLARRIQRPRKVSKMELCQVDFRLRVHRPHDGVATSVFAQRSVKSDSRVTMTTRERS